MSDDKASAATDPVREHLDKAENWLMLAEGNRGELIDLHEGVGTYTEAEDAQRWYFSFMFESAKDLAELHRAMAQTIYDLTPRWIVTNAPDWTVNVEAMGDALAEKLKVDAEEFDAQTLRPGADPEPVAEGELWTTGDGWFWYSVREGDEAAPARAQVPRWLLVGHYAQVLRWNSEQGVKPLPSTWSELGEANASDLVTGTLRRPTAEERATFYGPEPDPQPAPFEAQQWVGGVVPQICPDCEGRHVGDCAKAAIPPAPVAWFPEDDVTMKAWLRGLDPAQLKRLIAAASNERTERLYAE